jgi:hypothetical protein
MTAEIVNLRRYRKGKARDLKVAEADAARAKSGRTQAERALFDAEQRQEARRLDGARLTDNGATCASAGESMDGASLDRGSEGVSDKDWGDEIGPGNVS